jgi:NAD(P)-dependent dehydrogenase (short-subunit alcohol dehydrogenase family)
MPLRILITGANRGIGLEMTRQAAQRGDSVIAACRNPDTASNLQRLASEVGLQISIVGMDVANDSSVAAAASSISNTITGALDLVVANAGHLNARGGLQDPEHTQGNIAATLMTNVAGVFFTARHFLPHLRAAALKGSASLDGSTSLARLAVISSQMGSSTRAGISAPIYRASKAAATNLARSLSLELAPDNIAVGAWHPGWVQTDMGGSEAAITPQTSAAGLLSRFDSLSMQTSGVFEDYAGTPHPF